MKPDPWHYPSLDAARATVAALTALVGHAPPPSARQSADRLLQRKGHAGQFEKEWRLADPLFEAWVLQRPEDAF